MILNYLFVKFLMIFLIYEIQFTDKSLGDTASDVISDSSGVGTSQSDTTNSLSIPGTTVVCVESYSSGISGHISINQGDIIEGKIIYIYIYIHIDDLFII